MTDREHERVRLLNVPLSDLVAFTPGSAALVDLLGDLLAQIGTATQVIGPLPDGTIQIRYEAEARWEFELLEEVRAIAHESFERRQLN